jgi:hypothetical protein
MIEVKLAIKNTENLGVITQEHKDKIQEIFTALVSSGALTGVRGGKTIIHFDADGIFQGIELDYWPWRKRRQ